jgi:hypothetical protein
MDLVEPCEAADEVRGTMTGPRLRRRRRGPVRQLVNEAMPSRTMEMIPIAICDGCNESRDDVVRSMVTTMDGGVIIYTQEK